MVEPPKLSKGSEGDLKIQASFDSGRYWFTLSPKAKHLFDEILQYSRSDELPFAVFKTLVVTGDAYLPNHSDPIDVADDLAAPDIRLSPDCSTVQALVNLIDGNRYSTRQIKHLEQLKPSLERSGASFNLDSIEKKERKVENLQKIAEDL